MEKLQIELEFVDVVSKDKMPQSPGSEPMLLFKVVFDNDGRLFSAFVVKGDKWATVELERDWETEELTIQSNFDDLQFNEIRGPLKPILIRMISELGGKS